MQSYNRSGSPTKIFLYLTLLQFIIPECRAQPAKPVPPATQTLTPTTSQVREIDGYHVVYYSRDLGGGHSIIRIPRVETLEYLRPQSILRMVCSLPSIERIRNSLDDLHPSETPTISEELSSYAIILQFKDTKPAGDRRVELKIANSGGPGRELVVTGKVGPDDFNLLERGFCDILYSVSFKTINVGQATVAASIRDMLNSSIAEDTRFVFTGSDEQIQSNMKKIAKGILSRELKVRIDPGTLTQLQIDKFQQTVEKNLSTAWTTDTTPLWSALDRVTVITPELARLSLRPAVFHSEISKEDLQKEVKNEATRMVDTFKEIVDRGGSETDQYEFLKKHFRHDGQSKFAMADALGLDGDTKIMFEQDLEQTKKSHASQWNDFRSTIKSLSMTHNFNSEKIKNVVEGMQVRDWTVPKRFTLSRFDATKLKQSIESNYEIVLSRNEETVQREYPLDPIDKASLDRVAKMAARTTVGYDLLLELFRNLNSQPASGVVGKYIKDSSPGFDGKAAIVTELVMVRKSYGNLAKAGFSKEEQEFADAHADRVVLAGLPLTITLPLPKDLGGKPLFAGYEMIEPLPADIYSVLNNQGPIIGWIDGTSVHYTLNNRNVTVETPRGFVRFKPIIYVAK